MKRLTTTLALLAAALYASAQEATLPTPDAKALGMGGVAMTTLSGSHAIYNNSATAIFSQMPSQVSSSYYGQGEFDYYAVTGFCRFDNVNMAQIGWRQYLRERGNNDMAVDLGYSRRLGERWAVGIVGRYMHLKRHDDTADALAVDLSVAWSQPLENVGSHSTLRVGGKLGNLGGYLGKTDYTLPMDLTAGVALDTFLTDAHEITVGADWGYYFSPARVRGFQMSVGAEYNLMQLIQLRAGYHYGERRNYYPTYGSVGARRAVPAPAPRFRLPDRTQGDAAAQHVQHQLRTRFLRDSRYMKTPARKYPGRCFALRAAAPAGFSDK